MPALLNACMTALRENSSLRLRREVSRQMTVGEGHKMIDPIPYVLGPWILAVLLVVCSRPLKILGWNVLIMLVRIAAVLIFSSSVLVWATDGIRKELNSTEPSLGSLASVSVALYVISAIALAAFAILYMLLYSRLILHGSKIGANNSNS